MSSSTSLRQPTVFAATIAVLAGALSTDASAAIVNYLSGAATQTDSPIVYFNTPPETTPGFQRQFFEGYNAFSSQAYSGQVAQASASLASGTLRAATQFSGGTGGNGGITLASAFIGDNFDFSLLALIIYQPGTLDDIVPFCGANVMVFVLLVGRAAEQQHVLELRVRQHDPLRRRGPGRGDSDHDFRNRPGRRNRFRARTGHAGAARLRTCRPGLAGNVTASPDDPHRLGL